MWNTANEQRPQKKIPWLSLLPQTTTATPRERKRFPSSRNVRKKARNIIRNTPHFIVLSMVKTKATPLKSENSSRKWPKDKHNPKYSTKGYKSKSR